MKTFTFQQMDHRQTVRAEDCPSLLGGCMLNLKVLTGLVVKII